MGEGKASKEEVDSRYDGGMDAALEFTEKGTGLFKGEGGGGVGSAVFKFEPFFSRFFLFF